MNQWNLIVTGLAALLHMEQLFDDDPSLDETELVAPLIVTGLPRSGTTFLHRLLSTLEANEPVALYQHMFPLPRRPDTRKLETRAMFAPWRRASQPYDLDAIHHVRPTLPDECNFGIRLGLRSMIYWSTAPTYSYLRWLLDQDLREGYRLYRRVLQLHQRQAPGKRLTLKCPQHLAWLPALCERAARRALPRWAVDRHGAFMTGGAAVLVFVLLALPLLVAPMVGFPVEAGIVMLMAAVSSRNVAVRALTTRVPKPGEVARFLSLQTSVQQLAAMSGALLGLGLLSDGGGGRLLGMPVVASLAIAMSCVAPLLLRRLERLVGDDSSPS